MDGVERVQRLRIRAKSDALIVIALAEIPKPNLVEIMETDRSSNTVDEDGIRNRQRNDVGQVDSHEIGIPKDGLVRDIANDNKQ